MLERVRTLPAIEFDAQGYLDDFWRHADKADRGFWKLERIQDFREPEEPSWVAMMDGDWGRALSLIDEKRATARQQLVTEDGLSNRRIRIVETPVTPYLQWEMHVLKLWVEAGTQGIRVLDASKVGPAESDHPLPEVVILGRAVLYEVRYDSTGTHCGGRRIDDPDVITACCHETAELYEQGEDLLTYFEREIAPLPPPYSDH